MPCNKVNYMGYVMSAVMFTYLNLEFPDYQVAYPGFLNNDLYKDN